MPLAMAVGPAVVAEFAVGLGEPAVAAGLAEAERERRRRRALDWSRSPLGAGIAAGGRSVFLFNWRAFSNIRQVRTQPHFAQHNGAFEEIIARCAATLTPFSINIRQPHNRRALAGCDSKRSHSRHKFGGHGRPYPTSARDKDHFPLRPFADRGVRFGNSE